MRYRISGEALAKAAVAGVFGAMLTASATADEGIFARCQGRAGDTAFVIALVAGADFDGGYRLTRTYSGSYPTESVSLGATSVTFTGKATYEIELQRKAGELLGVPIFDGVATQPETIVVDRLGRYATFRDVQLDCVRL